VTAGLLKDGRYALVRLGFPWSIHFGEATYILERTNGGWKVLLRDFISFVWSRRWHGSVLRPVKNV